MKPFLISWILIFAFIGWVVVADDFQLRNSQRRHYDIIESKLNNEFELAYTAYLQALISWEKEDQVKALEKMRTIQNYAEQNGHLGLSASASEICHDLYFLIKKQKGKK